MPSKTDTVYWREYQREYQKEWRKDNPRYSKEYRKTSHKEARKGKGLLSIFGKEVKASDYFFLVDDIVEDLKNTPRPRTSFTERTHRGVCKLVFKFIPEATLPFPFISEVTIHFQVVEAYKRAMAKKQVYKDTQELFDCIKKELPAELEKREFSGPKCWLEFARITQGI